MDQFYIDKVDYFTKINLLSKNPVGRDIAWAYYQYNFYSIVDEYSIDDPRIGQALIDITKSFENEFLLYNLIQFTVLVEEGAVKNARLKSLETCSTNVLWVINNELQLTEAFPINGRKAEHAHSLNVNPLLDQTESKKSVFIRNSRETLKKKMEEHKISSLFY